MPREAEEAVRAVLSDYDAEIPLERFAVVPLSGDRDQATLHGALDYIAGHAYPGLRYVISPPMRAQSWNGRLGKGAWPAVNAITRTGRRPAPSSSPDE